jgi:hypothetical protein
MDISALLRVLTQAPYAYAYAYAYALRYCRLAAESVAWPAVQAWNFWRVPVQHQLLVVNVVSLADCTFLSWVKHQQDILAWRERLKGGPFGP